MIPINATLDLDIGVMVAKSAESVMSADDLLKDVKEIERASQVDDAQLEDETVEDDAPVTVEQVEGKAEADTSTDDSEVSTETDTEVQESTSEKVPVETDDADDEEEMPKGEADDSDESEEAASDDVEEEPTKADPSIDSVTKLARWMRNEGYKLSVFNIKDTLLRYLEMFGERKVARHVVDQDSHSFYEIHSSYVPGSAIYAKLVKLGFKALHPTQLSGNYRKDMSYEVAMSNGKLHIQVFGGLQQHAPNEETVIRNLYATEKFKYSIGQEYTSLSSTESLIKAEERVARNLLLAAMQTHSLDRKDLANEFFQEAMASSGIDALMLSMSEDVEALDISQESPNMASPEVGEDEDEIKVEDAEGDESNQEVDEDSAEDDGDESDSDEEDESDGDDDNSESEEEEDAPESEEAEAESESASTDTNGVVDVFENAPNYVEVSDILADKANAQIDTALTDEQRVAIMMPAEKDIFQVE